MPDPINAFQPSLLWSGNDMKKYIYEICCNKRKMVPLKNQELKLQSKPSNFQLWQQLLYTRLVSQQNLCSPTICEYELIDHGCFSVTKPVKSMLLYISTVQNRWRARLLLQHKIFRFYLKVKRSA